MSFKICKIQKSHKEKIHKLIAEVNQADDLSYSLTDEWLDYVIENAGQGIFLAFQADRLAGMATAMINPLYKDQGALNVVVSPFYRKKGLAALLYKEIHDFSKRSGLKIVEAYVKERLDAAANFAKRRDFKTVLYSWEMEMKLKDLEQTNPVSGELKGLSFRIASHLDELNYKKIIFDAFGDNLSEDALGQSLQDPSIIIFILEKENKAIGSASVQLKEDLSLAYIYDIGILTEERGQGLGSYLLKSCLLDLQRKKQESIVRASLSVTGENKRALELYRKIGFEQVDLDLIMTKSLD